MALKIYSGFFKNHDAICSFDEIPIKESAYPTKSARPSKRLLSDQNFDAVCKIQIVNVSYKKGNRVNVYWHLHSTFLS